MIFWKRAIFKAVTLRAFCSSESTSILSHPQPGNALKIIKVALIGIPNAGKSTLVNRLIGYNVCGVSKCTHTTKTKLQAALTLEDTQIIFVDTPGIVKDHEAEKFKLKGAFIFDAINATIEADIIGIVHDVASFYTCEKLDYKIIEVLEKMPKNKKAFLILNKVDRIKQKRKLLDRIRILTSSGKRIKDENDISNNEENQEEKKSLPVGWPHFSRVFLVSALSGDGLEDVVRYLQNQALPGLWEISPEAVTNTPPQQLIVQQLKAHFLELIPYSIPRFIKCSIDHFEIGRLGEISCAVNVKCLNANHKKFMVKWKVDNRRVLELAAKNVEADVSSILKVPVFIKIVVDSEKKI